ncbi:origin recognition complex subunit 1-like isoform X2 [Hydractinia symbiolongicarpus]|uniref:origin recognition complex subunit 1-like isoform X2 n=1 Tax=Hydractinia symbiolongicarpus TaxID=13093 RepID=UPI00254FB3D5|nr:origin recognition complex subunit 1-like isoform X2 [Hydractinia symbiolongicarpus]
MFDMLFFMKVTKKNRLKDEVESNQDNSETLEALTTNQNSATSDVKDSETNIVLTTLPEEVDTSALMTEDIEALLDESSVLRPTNIKATVKCAYSALNLTDISVKKNDAVKILYKQDNFVYVRNKKGVSGFIPVSYCYIANKNESSSKKSNRKNKNSKNSKTEIKSFFKKDKTKNEESAVSKKEKKNVENNETVETDKDKTDILSKKDITQTENKDDTVEHTADQIIPSPTPSEPDVESVVETNDNNNNIESNNKQDISENKDDTLSSTMETPIIKITAADKSIEDESHHLPTSDVGSSVSSSHQSLDQLMNGETSLPLADTIEVIKEEIPVKKEKRRNKPVNKHFSIKNLLKKKKQKENCLIENDKNLKAISSKSKRWSGSHIDWYSDLFKEDVSDSSESEEDITSSTDTDTNKSHSDVGAHALKNYKREQTLARSKHRRASDTSASSDFYIPKRTRASTFDNDAKTNYTKDDLSELDKQTTSGYATIRKTNSLRYSVPPSDTHQDQLNTVNRSLQKSSSSSNLKNSNKKNRRNYSSDVEVDVLHSPLVPRKLISPTADQSGDTWLRQDGRRTPLSSINPNKQTQNKRIVSYDFIATEENEVTILTGQHVDVLKKPDEDWWWVCTVDGREGFVPQSFLTPVPTVPTRKPDLLQKLYSGEIVTVESQEKSTERKVKTPVNLPTRHIASDSPKLAKVAPFYQEYVKKETNSDDFQLYKKQVQEIHKHKTPPPSYSQHVMHRQHLELMAGFYADPKGEKSNKFIGSRDWQGHKNVQYIQPSSTPPRIVRRKSFSGRQKRVRFSNEVEHDRNNPGSLLVIKQYGLDPAVHGEEETEISTWC